MHDFPPVVTDPQTSSAAAPAKGAGRSRDFSAADTRGPARFLAWLYGQQASLLIVSSLWSVLEFAPGAVGPYLVGRAVDSGIVQRDLRQVLFWAGLLLALILVGVAAGILRHTLIVRSWLVTMYGVMKMVTRKTAQMGHVMPRRTATGEILSVFDGDSDQFGALTEVGTRAVGALVGYLVVAGLVLSTSWQLGVVVLVAAPVLVGLATPLLRPMQRRQEIERNRNAELIGLATDIVAGLRILRGIGGERTFAGNYAAQSERTRKAGVSAGVWQAAVDALGVLFSGLFLVVLTWLGAQQVLAGQLSVGGLISFFGYAVFMVWPIQTFFELVQESVRCMVSARKAIVLLEQRPPWRAPQEPLQLPAAAPIRDAQSGFVARPGLLIVVVCAVPDDSAALADRLGRYLPSDADPVKLDVDEGVKGRAARRERARRQAERDELVARDDERASRPWAVDVGGVDLGDVDIEAVRQHIMVNESSSLVFAGTLQSMIDPHGRLSLAEAEAVLHTAAAEEIFEALPGGWQGVLDERGRGLSGGQRQRLVLARALAVDPPILILVEPTSAVDAHTEAMIAARLADHRRGRTTVVMSVSPLLLHHADEVALLEGTEIVATGTHHDLLTGHAGYRRVVVRSEEVVQ